ncbi:hypothetical protein CAPN006_21350 [Capnocytophaga canimorsus]|uniref:hypothetical protein n=1 Tax=Capnocytophaga canimorsus TaxID=28188 RepID=UPI001AD406F8|nr:hypothetical protein [Capnocytophaga canimorsus]GIM57743.1 hypothetical protein CAPN006_21350 [Capnocytophaga canimorsus]
MIATFTLHATGQKVSAELKEIERKYLIHFRRPDNYEGEFGFDWMRDNYKEICNDYEALKKEYYDAEKKEKVEIEGQEYFVPWLSMFPNQKGVKLNLEVEKIDDYQVRDDDYIELPAKAGVSFNPDTFKVSEINQNTMVEVICETPLISDTTIEVLSKNDKCIVGKLNVFKNATSYKLNVRFVEVKFKGSIQHNSDGIENKLDFSSNKSVAKASFLLEPNVVNLNMSRKIAEWKNYVELKEKEFDKKFQQSLIKYSPNRTNRGKIDYETLVINFGNFVVGTNKGGKGIDKIKKSITSIDIDGIACKMENFIKGLKEMYESNVMSKKGVIVFLLPIIIRYSNPPKTEVFRPQYFDGFADDIFSEGRYVMLAWKSPKFRDSTLIHEIAHTLGLVHSFQEKEIDNGREVISKHIFEYGTTDNIMDYSVKSDVFWKWQWEKMQEDINDLIPEKL